MYSDAGLLGPMLLMIDFVVAYITYGLATFGLAIIPLGGFIGDLIVTGIRAIMFAVLFMPVYFNGRQVRDLLREVRASQSPNEPQQIVAGSAATASSMAH